MVIFKCDRCGADINKNKDVVAPSDLDNRIPTSEKDIANICYDITKEKFDGKGVWKENEYIHLCKKCTSELHAFLENIDII